MLYINQPHLPDEANRRVEAHGKGAFLAALHFPSARDS